MTRQLENHRYTSAAMSWCIEEQEVERIRALDIDARYALAINKIREHGELWTLASDDGWAVNRLMDGSSTIAIWPHARFAELEATGHWADNRPERISLTSWLSDARAAWFERHDLRISVFLVGDSTISAPHGMVADELRAERRARYARAKPGIGRARQRKRSTRPTRDLVTYINDREIDLIVGRVPAEFRIRLRDVFRRRSSDASILGSVSTRGRRDIEVTAELPVRLGLGRYLHGGQSPAEFGAPKLGQWPPWAVRRFLLYDVLLHEIGHLQIVDPRASRVNREFASETRAQELADELRRALYSEPFDHADPIHNAPTPVELSMLEVWDRLDKRERAQLVNLVLAAPSDPGELSWFGALSGERQQFLVRVLT